MIEPPSGSSDRVLIVDDADIVRRSLTEILEGTGYGCQTARNVPEARELMRAQRFDLVICDMNLEGESGMVLVEEIDRLYPQTAVLMATAEDSPEIARAASLRGANGYLVKPFSNNELLINADHALQERRRRLGRGEVSPADDRAADTRAAEVRAALAVVADHEAIVDHERMLILRQLSDAVGRRDLETGAHIRRIGEYSCLLARLLGWPEAEAELIRHASPMHDIGKVAIPDAILLKPGALDPAERKLMERHAEIGYEILSGSEAPLNVLAATIALTHHERIDGTGYPRGLSGEEIPIAGRIVAVADVFDALVSRRPYRPALSIAEATAIMRDARGDHVDAAILDVFLGNLDQVEAIRQAHLDPTGDRRAPEPTGSRLE